MDSIFIPLYPLFRYERGNHSLKSKKIECPPRLCIENLIFIQKIIKLLLKIQRILKHIESKRRIYRKNRLNNYIPLWAFYIPNDCRRPDILFKIFRRDLHVLWNHLKVAQKSPNPFWFFKNVSIFRVIDDMTPAFSKDGKIFSCFQREFLKKSKIIFWVSLFPWDEWDH